MIAYSTPNPPAIPAAKPPPVPVQSRHLMVRGLEVIPGDLFMQDIPLYSFSDDWLASYNNDRTHQGKMCCGRTPMQTLIDGKEVWHDKITSLNS